MNFYSIKTFLQTIFGEDEQINFQVINLATNHAPKINGCFTYHNYQLLKQFNNQNYEIFFIVNSGGYRKKDITKFNAVFLDLDYGKDQDGNYYSLDEVKFFKKRMMDKLSKFKLKPSLIIETRNGFHVYWLLEDGASYDQFQECQERLITYFNGDKQVKNPNRLLRVPGFNWCKDINNKFPITLVEENQLRYNIQDIINSLPALSIEVNGDLGDLDNNNNNITSFYL